MPRYRAGLLALAFVLVALPVTAADGAAPRLSIRDMRTTETDSPKAVFFVVKMSRAARKSVTVRFATRSATARSPSDFATRSGKVRLRPGQRRQLIRVTVTGDRTQEATETFGVRLRRPVRARLGDRSAVGTIKDNDPVPAVSAGDALVNEGGTASVPLTLSNPSATSTIAVSYATLGVSATSGDDYTPATGAATFPPGTTTATVSVPTATDSLDEDDETLAVGLSAPVNGTVDDESGTVTILDTNAPPTLSVANGPTVDEAGAGPLSTTFAVTLSEPSGRTVTVAYATTDDLAVAPGDYTATSGTLTYAPGEVTKNVTVTVIDDDDYDQASAELFKLDLTNPVNATIADGSGTAAILDDENVCIAPDGPGTAVALGPVRGDAGADTLNQSQIISPCGDQDWFSFALNESSGSPVTLTAVVRLFSAAKSPSFNDDVDLCVWNSGGTLSACSTATAGTTEIVCVTKSDAAGDDSRTVVIQVDGFGNSVNNYTLQVDGNVAFPGGCSTLTLG